MTGVRSRWRKAPIGVGLATAALIPVLALSPIAPLGFGERRFVSKWSLPALGDGPLYKFDEYRLSDLQTPLFQRWLADKPQHVSMDAEIGRQYGLEAATCLHGYEIPGGRRVAAVRCTIEQGRAVDERQWRVGLGDLDRSKPWESMYAGDAVFLVAAESPGLDTPARGHERATGTLAVGTADGQLLRWVLSVGVPRALPPARLDGAVTALHFVSGRPLLASGDARGTIQLWANEGAPVALPKVHEGPVYALDATREGRLLSAGFDGRLIVWDANTRQKLAEHVAHQGPIYQLRKLRGGRFATAGYDGFVRVWSADGSTRLAERHVHYGPVYYIEEAGALGDAYIRSVGWDGLDKQWFFEAATPNVRATAWLERAEARSGVVISSIAVSPDGALLAVNQAGWLRTWSLAGGTSPQWPDRPIHSHHAGTMVADERIELAFSRDGRSLAFPYLPSPRAIDVHTGQPRADGIPELVTRTGPFVVWVKELGEDSSMVVKEGLVESEIAGDYSDAAYIPARTWSDVLFGRINVALTDMTGTTYIGFVQPRVPLVASTLAVAALLAVWGVALRRRVDTRRI